MLNFKTMCNEAALSHLPVGTEENTVNINQSSWSWSRNSNQGPPEYEALQCR